MTDQKIFKYPGKEIDVFWDKRLCIHIGECGNSEGELFIGGRQPWCKPDVVDVEEVIDVVKRCPTGALTYKLRDGGSEEIPESNNQVRVAHRGPLYITGALEIENLPDEMAGANFRVALCRCGASVNKPFCDNNHENIGFNDYGAVGNRGPGLAEVGGALEIRAIEDGPLMLKGNFNIQAGSGREAWSGTGTALCRCGASKRKPFCDGSHKEIEFKST